VTTIGDLLRRTASCYPDRVALVDAGDPSRRWTWAELHGAALAGAHRLAATHAPGDTVAIWAPSEPAWVVLELACALAGLIVQPIDPTQEAEAVVDALRRTGAVSLAVAGDPGGCPIAPGHRDLPALREVIALGAERHAPVASSLPTVTATMGALVLPTSGTTGRPKAALLSHRAVTADARLVTGRMGLRVDDTWLTVMPLHRSGGCGTTVVGCVATGATMVCSPTWAAAELLDLLDTTGASVVSAFPRALHALVDELGAGGRRAVPLGVRLVQTGGAPVSPDLVRSVGALLGARMSVVYGLTEASPVLTQTDQGDLTDDSAASVGRPLPGTEVAVRDPETGAVVGPGAVGEVVARGPQIMDGYVGDPAATSRAIDSDGWLHTGDLGWLDTDGRLHVEGRADDVIERDGRRWLPGPVERALAAVPGVADAVVVNSSGPGGEVVAFVQPRPGHALDERSLRGAVAVACGEDSVPDRVVVADDLPALPSGKVRRFVLREWAGSLVR
jgi:fatty-acyl-CoA synthase